MSGDDANGRAVTVDTRSGREVNGHAVTADTGRRRRRTRRILLLASLPLTIAGAVVAAKLLAMSGIASSAVQEYAQGRYESSAAEAGDLLAWNAFEPWVAYFDRGTAIAAGGDYNAAVPDLERALSLAPAGERCDVAVNLSLSWELLGDSYAAQGLFVGAERLYETAEAVITAEGPECAPEPPPGETDGPSDAAERDSGQELADAAERLAQKLDASARQQAQAEGGGDGTTPSEQLDELDQQNDDAAAEKAERDAENRGGQGSGGQAERPW
ncbi:hypothetical protein [Marisediminicola senii]|uniref:hypothetical protein n=1 Tax=Marisediminicola senii TaxID=2711233 RepID=UPI0013EE0799|nr:hypothetical protein [Marisediminicola senii]